jgi:hypothetical protein
MPVRFLSDLEIKEAQTAQLSTIVQTNNLLKKSRTEEKEAEDRK